MCFNKIPVIGLILSSCRTSNQPVTKLFPHQKYAYISVATSELHVHCSPYFSLRTIVDFYRSQNSMLCNVLNCPLTASLFNWNNFLGVYLKLIFFPDSHKKKQLYEAKEIGPVDGGDDGTQGFSLHTVVFPCSPFCPLPISPEFSWAKVICDVVITANIPVNGNGWMTGGKYRELCWRRKCNRFRGIYRLTMHGSSSMASIQKNHCFVYHHNIISYHINKIAEWCL